MYRDYWNRTVDEVPGLTGAASVMDLHDLRPVLEALGIVFGDVLDVGCGTGRLSQVCENYRGVDISPAMVEYCNRAGIDAELIDGPGDLGGEHEWVACMSVFTHIPRSERRLFLERFAGIAPNLLVDIIPGEEGGDVSGWVADPDAFESDVREWFNVDGVYEQLSPDGALHRCRLRLCW